MDNNKPKQVNASGICRPPMTLAYLMDKRLTPREKVTILYLEVRCGLNGHTWVTRSTISRDLGFSTRQVSRVTSQLESKEIIQIQHRKDESNIYRPMPLDKVYGEKAGWGYDDYWMDKSVQGGESNRTTPVAIDDGTPGHERLPTRRKKQVGKVQVGKASRGALNPPPPANSEGNALEGIHRLHSDCIKHLRQTGCSETFSLQPNAKEKDSWLRLVGHCQGNVDKAAGYISSVCKNWQYLKQHHKKLRGFPDPVFFGSAWFTTLSETLKQISVFSDEPDIFEVVTISNTKQGDQR